MTSGLAADAVPIDAAVIRAALDGRTQKWLARRAGIHETTICRLLQPAPGGGRPLALRSTYERMRAALPSLPPPPGPPVAPNGHEGARPAGAGEGAGA